jgi:protein-disulfide isomerase
MKECEFCDEEFEGEKDLHVHWMDEHEDELNSHQKDKAKKAKREREEREKVRKEQRKKYVFYGVGALVLLGVAGVLGAQLMPSGGGGDISIEGEPMIGNESANVTVVEFGDFQCPACNRFEQGAFSRIKSEYIDSGEVKFYWKDFPLSGHEWAQPAAESMECVYREDEEAFWNVKTELFNNQGSISLGNVEDKIVGWAEDEGVNSTEVRSCIDGGDSSGEVREDRQEGLGNGVTGTPSIYVNGDKVDSFDYNTVSQAIEEELK